VDAFKVAVGAVMIQITEDTTGKEDFQLIPFASAKFSDTARHWDMFKKEAYANYWGVKKFAYQLRGKAFILETDHQNLLWIEKSEVPIDCNPLARVLAELYIPSSANRHQEKHC